MQQVSKPRYYGQFDPPVDRFLHERYFLNRARPGFFIECGAFDGETECSCKFFEETLGWRGINVEPVPSIFSQLARNRPHSTNVNAALASTRGHARFTAIVHPTFGELCTNGSLRHTPEHAALIAREQWATQPVEVATLTWDDLIREHGVTEVDLLVLDVEGTELDVIAGMRGSRVLPRIFCVEHGHLGVETLRRAVEPLGYDYDTSKDVNSFFVRRSRPQG
jgi:FkbM family methyltransferase